MYMSLLKKKNIITKELMVKMYIPTALPGCNLCLSLNSYLSKSITSLVFLCILYFKSIDVASSPKDFEVDIAKVLAEIPGVELDHLPEKTGKTALYHDREVRPDITGTYYGKRFVMDIKHYGKKLHQKL